MVILKLSPLLEKSRLRTQTEFAEISLFSQAMKNSDFPDFLRNVDIHCQLIEWKPPLVNTLRISTSGQEITID